MTSLNIYPDVDFRFYKATSTIKIPDKITSLLGKQHIVLTSTLSVTVSKLKTASKPTGLKYFVGGISSFKSEKYIYQYFSQFGTINTVKIMKDRSRGSNRGFAFITFISKDGIECSLRSESTFHTIQGVTVESKLAVTKEEMNQSRFLGMLAKEHEKVRLKRISTDISEESNPDDN